LVWKVHEENGWTAFSLPALPTVDVRGAPFSAASRDPEQRRFANIGAYFNQGYRSQYPCSLCVRVTVRDQRTGKYGLLWEEGKETPRDYIRHDWGTSVFSELKVMVGGGGDGVQGWTRFAICPEPNEEDMAEEDRLYRVARGGGIPGDDHHFRLMIDSTGIAQVGSMIRSLCCVVGR
jgi:hypothetical protein